jgi:hypothetical protein
MTQEAQTDLEIKPEAGKKKDVAKKDFPDQVQLASVYSFYDDEGIYHYWNEGQVVTEPETIAALVERDAPIKEV